MAAPIPFFRLPFAIASATAPVLPANSVKSLFPTGPEFDADAHWLLGGSAASLVDVVSGRSLIPAGAAPTYGTNFVTTADSNASGLLSPFDDAVEQTVCTVFQRPSVGGDAVIFGSLTSSSAAGGNGALMLTSGALQAQTRGYTAEPVSVAQSAATAAGTWYFLAIAQTATERRIVRGALGTAIITAGTKTLATPMRKVALGNGGYGSSSFLKGLSAAEFINYSRGLTVDEMAAVYERSKLRMADRGITVA
ncbi:hypothetical protein [Methylorubrum populi]|uniref:LamG domain-containing protein n=1 Tax=Methylorubrum populi TaxID=223967 RepID=A0A833J022_9HYPH|nr:hypothetical protein [Methylorubrum populi]KAB7782180.1 hypothetical protein F8B43_4935 [Methylorubrum populi]